MQNPSKPFATAAALALASLGLTSFALLQDDGDADVTPVAATTGDDPDPADTATTDAARTGLVVIGGPAAVAQALGDDLAACAASDERLAGEDRYATAVAVARRLDAARQTQSEVVFIASGRDFPDALAAGPLVAHERGVLLLTDRDLLPDATRTELARRTPSRVVVLGGEAAIGPSVERQLGTYAPSVTRIAGEDRYATAALVAAELPASDAAVLVSGVSFPDALAMGPRAARAGDPVLLTRPGALPDATAATLRQRGPTRVRVGGGDAVVGPEVLTAVRDLVGAGGEVTALAGADRYSTAVAIARADAAVTPLAGILLANGRGFADALAAGPLAAELGAALLLTDGETVVADATDVFADAVDSDCAPTSFAIDATEALTLGPSSIGGTTLRWEVGGWTDRFATATDRGTALLPAGSTAEVHFSYPTPAGGVPAVSWSQQLTAGSSDLLARQAWRGTPAPVADPDAEVVLAWQYTGDSNRYRQEVAAAPGLTVTAPFRYFLGQSGTLSGGGADAAFIADMHARGVDVWPTIHTGGAAAIRAALTDPVRRAEHARAIVADAAAAGADGVNIDIEGYELPEAEAVTDFVEQFAVLAREAGLVTSFDFTTMTDTWITPPAGYEFWSTAPDRRRISEAVDYAILMAYDQFNRFRPRGPVASEAWVEEGLRYQLRYSDPERTLLGVPLYGRTWNGNSPSAVGIGRIEEYVRDGVSEVDPQFGVDKVTLGNRVTWAETVAGLQHRVDLAAEYGLPGTASWRLGFDIPSVWGVLGAS